MTRMPHSMVHLYFNMQKKFNKIRERIEEIGHLRSKRMSRSESYHNIVPLLKFLGLNILQVKTKIFGTIKIDQKIIILSGSV